MILATRHPSSFTKYSMISFPSPSSNDGFFTLLPRMFAHVLHGPVKFIAVIYIDWLKRSYENID